MTNDNNSYNIAIKYLQGKYGKRAGYTCKFNKELWNIRLQKDRALREKNATDNDYIVIIKNDLIDKTSNDYVIWLLVTQYHCLSNNPKHELEGNLKAHGLLK